MELTTNPTTANGVGIWASGIDTSTPVRVHRVGDDGIPRGFLIICSSTQVQALVNMNKVSSVSGRDTGH